MLTFFHQCYATKYGKAVRDVYDVERVSTAQLREFTRGFAHKCKRKANEADDKWERRRLMAAKKAMPEDAILRRYCRLALLNWTYWLNGYRPGGEAFCDPLELFEGLPYYGYIQDPEHPNRYTLSPIVSPPKPVPDNVLPYIGLHVAEAKAAVEQARQVAREQLAKEDAEAADMAREQERLERQRKLADKQKRLDTQDRQRANPGLPKKAPVQSRLTHTAQLSGIKRAKE